MSMNIAFLQAIQLPDLFIDALVTDKDDQLVFLSAWGSEAHIQQMRANLALSPYEEGALRVLSMRYLREQSDVFYPRMVRLTDRERLDCVVGRPAANTLFAHLTQLWVYDKLALMPDRANARALLLRLHNEDPIAFHGRIWQTVQSLSRTPLHSSWENLLTVFQNNGWVKKTGGFGIDACVIDLPEPDVETLVMTQVHHGELTLPAVY